MPGGILFVCSGNICRSPMAEYLTAAKLAQIGLNEINVRSAGTLEIFGQEASTFAQQIMSEAGIDLSPHRSRGLSDFDLEEFDWIVVMAPEHEEALKRRGSGKSPPIVRLWEHLDPAAADLGFIPDPIGTTISTYRACCNLIERALDNWLASVRAGMAGDQAAGKR